MMEWLLHPFRRSAEVREWQLDMMLRRAEKTRSCERDILTKLNKENGQYIHHNSLATRTKTT